jgi:nucleotide-binding universal stress UspA family protein
MSHRPFVFGLDLTYKSHGALVFAAWLRAMLGPDEVEAVHIIASHEDAARRDERLQRAQVVIHERLGASGHGQTFARIQVQAAGAIVEALTGIESVARALVLGRRTRSGERALVHLGPVARKLLRDLPLPMIIVPPELGPTALGGPILLATDLEAHSEDAARFAEQLARESGRELILVHIAEVHHNEYVDETDPDWRATAEQFRGEAETRLDGWAAAHGLAKNRRIALLGAAVERLLELCEEEHPSLLVLGSRRLSVTTRLYTTSTASTLAAYAPCPVAVVPPASPA